MNHQIKLISEKFNIESEKIIVSRKQLAIIEQHSVKDSNKIYEIVKIRVTDKKMTYNDLIIWNTFKSKVLDLLL